MSDFDENFRNPSVNTAEKNQIKNHFLIKYTTDIRKELMLEILKKIILDKEIKDSMIETKMAFLKDRIVFNGHTILKEGKINEENLSELIVKLSN